MACKLKTLVTKFLAWCESACAENTAKAYRYYLGKFLAHVGDREISRIRPMHLTAWGKSWHEYQAVIRLFRWAAKDAGMIKASPFEGVKMPGRNQRKRILSPAELMRFVRQSRPAGRRFLIALRETFARPQEIRSATWEDLQSEDPGLPIDVALVQGKCLIVLHEFKDRSKRRDSSTPRVILVSKRLGRLIARLRSGSAGGDSAIFSNSRGRAWTGNAIRCLMRRLRVRMGSGKDRRGENIVAYTFRHSCATTAASKGIRDRVLADILGHVETRTTARYQHLCVAHLRAAMDTLTARRPC